MKAIIVLWVAITTTARAQSPTDSLALVEFYNATNGPNWYATWNLEAPVSEWYGVDVEAGRVSGLTLVNNGLTGIIPASIADLDALAALDLSFNALSGGIPAMPENLFFLDLSHNAFTGSVPVGVNRLWYLNLSYNQLTGSIPLELSDASSLSELDLSYNDLEGVLPSALSALAELGYLNVSHNRLSGQLPESFGNLEFMTILDVSHNLFSGALPESYNNLLFLNELHVNDNELDELPEITGPLLPGAFFAQNNRFDFGDIEANVSKFTGAAVYAYAPQDSILDTEEITVFEGDEVTISVPTPGASNRYQWYFNGEAFSESATVVFNATQSGVFDCDVTNDAATELVLHRRPIRLNVMALQYPGDANRDRTCDAMDVFVIASAYGAQGSAREEGGVLWQPYPSAQDWPLNLDYRGQTVNAKFCDADGDGAVTLFDVAAALANRGLSY